MDINLDSPIVPNGHFTWREYLTLRMWNTTATIKKEEIENAIFLFENIETLIRRPLGKPLIISSGYRSFAYMKYLRSIGIPAALMSAHNSARAVDLEAPHGMTNEAFWKFCDARWLGRMENLKHTPGWVHLDTLQWGKKIRFNP